MLAPRMTRLQATPSVRPAMATASPRAAPAPRALGNQATLRRLAQAGVQAQLAIGRSDDPLEHEADRVAEQVMRMPDPAPAVTPTPLRVSRKCAACEEEEAAVQRKPTTAQAPPVTAPALVQQALAAPGRPLDATARGFMEPRFGRDFADVRIHTDPLAGQSAHSIQALAYTAGRHIVFAPSAYAPTTAAGQRLLAHELTHVLQQDAAAPRRLARAPDPAADPAEAAPVAAPAPPGGAAPPAPPGAAPPPAAPALPACDAEHQRTLQTLSGTSIAWLQTSIAALTSLLAGPAAAPAGGGAPAAAPAGANVAAVQAALSRHFNSATPDTARKVQDGLVKIRDYVAAAFAANTFCAAPADPLCGASGGYQVPGGQKIVWCPTFFSGDPSYQAAAIVHESAHAVLGVSDRAYRTDRAYRQISYVQISTAEALNNAESFGLLTRELGTGQAVAATAPTDNFDDCDKDGWKAAVQMAVARAQRWNRNAQVGTQDQRPTWLTGWTDLQTQYLGGTQPADLARAEKVYTALANALASNVDFQCEPSGGGRCDKGAQTYWYAIFSDFHLCPAWLALPSEDERVTAMLTGLYGYDASVGDNTVRWNYAKLARDLNKRFWP